MSKIPRTALVIENGLFQSLAHKLSESYEKVLYWRPWIGSFAHPNDFHIGTGYSNIERIQYYEPYFDDDNVTWIFADIYQAPLQEWLRAQGKPVWGPGNGEELELLRGETKELMEEIGLPVQPWEWITGMKALRAFIKENPGWHVKVSTVRGLTESFHAIDYDLVKPKLDVIEAELGGRAEVQEFIVERGIPDALEVGYDGYCIDGKFPKFGVQGVEIKDCGYAAQVKPYMALNKDVRFVNDKLSPEMAKYHYRGFFSSEIRIGKDRKPYLIDNTCRCASPAGECYQELFLNLGEIIEGGARGVLVEPVLKHRFAAQAMLTSPFAEENWLPITIPDKIRGFVKLYHSCMVNGQEFIVPGEYDMAEIGSIVATGNTLDEAIKTCCGYAEQVKAFQLKCNTQAMDKAKSELAKA